MLLVTFTLSCTVSEMLQVWLCSLSIPPLLFRLKFGVFPLELIHDVRDLQRAETKLEDKLKCVMLM